LFGLVQEDTLMTPCKDAHLFTQVQEYNLVTSPKEAHFNSKQQEVCQLNIGVAQQLEGKTIVREHCNESSCDLDKAPSVVAGTDYVL
jgi:hypothetical protein